jgi:magnesium chelatase family protein
LSQVERYMAKISGPLLDRIDIHVEVPGVPFHELSDDAAGTDSQAMANQVETARQVQLERFTGDNGFSETGANGNMSPPEIRCHCRLQGAAEKLLKLAMEQMGLSARAHDRILRVSRTIADLSGDADIGEDHLSEAINFRALDRSYWN